MPKHIVAVVGRPNVGKSTFVNRIAQANDAIVHEMRGVTRDRSYHEADWNGMDFTLIDTGGIEMGNDDRFQGSIRDQAFAATEECDVILFLVDGKTGINADDEEVARVLRKSKTPVLLIVNKMDDPGNVNDIYEFYSLGLGDPYPISAQHGNGVGDILDDVVASLPEATEEEIPEDLIRVAIVGRPNAGKSSLLNRLCGEQRSIVSDVAGTTRDAVDTLVEHEGVKYRLIDTAGMRKRTVINEDLEFYSYVRAERAIERADVALIVIDSTIGVTEQDQRVAGMAHNNGIAVVVLLNKWDLVDTAERREEL